MKWSFSIARISGIDVRIHLTFLLLPAFFGWINFQTGGWAGAWAGVSFILLLFLCVLLHEFGHAFAARAFGIRTPDITLLPIGGVARLERMPRNPWQELVVAVAGPAVNIVIAVVLFFILGRFIVWENVMEMDQNAPGQLLVKLMIVNVWLVLFNMIPAFPMDGGRILRALLAMKLRHETATTIAARVGQVLAGLFAVLGIVSGNFLLIFIAVFVFMGAQQEAMMARLYGSVAEGATVTSAMATQFSTLPADIPIWQASEQVSQNMQSVFPLVDEQMHCQGLVAREAVLQASAEGKDMLPVYQLSKVTFRIPVSESFEKALEGMQKNRVSVAAVVNPHGQLVGLVSLGMLLERSKFRR